MATPLSDIVASDIAEELSLNPDFEALTDPQRLQLFNSVAQDIAEMCIAAGRTDYDTDNLVGVTSGITDDTVRGYEPAVSGSHVLVFDNPFPAEESAIHGDYVVSAYGFQAGTDNPVEVTFKQEPEQVTFYVSQGAGSTDIFWEYGPLT